MRNMLTGIAREMAGAARVAADPRSFVRYASDVILYRVLRVIPMAPRLRTILLRDGSRVTYRLNRGDIRTVNEIWGAEIYRLPFPVQTLSTVVDLGANIGLTDVYLSARYRCSFLPVEPSERNSALARRNYAQNGVDAELVRGAVGPSDRAGHFAAHRDFNSGKLADSGEPVTVLSMPTLFARLPEDHRIDLLKVDIEGGEGELFSGDLGWLDRVDAMIVEFHPTLVDHERLIALIAAQGFRYIPAGSVSATSMDAFVRDRERSQR